MADSENSLEIEGISLEDTLQKPFPFHPTMTPRGLMFYNNLILDGFQQNNLNNLKAETIRENNKYLAQHPEIRALVSLFVRHLLKGKSHIKSIPTEAAKFFRRPKIDIEEEIEHYLRPRGEPKREASSGLVTPATRSASSVHLESKDFSYVSYTEGTSVTQYSTPSEWESPEGLQTSGGIAISHIIDYLVTSAMNRSEYEGEMSFTFDDVAVASPGSSRTEDTSKIENELNEE